MVNMESRKFVGLNLTDGELNSYAQMLGCEWEEWPLRYWVCPGPSTFGPW